MKAHGRRDEQRHTPREPGWRARAAGVAASLAALAGLAHAQAPSPQPPEREPAPAGEDRASPELEPFEGRPVRAVVFVVPARRPEEANTPLPPEDESLARNQLRQREQTPFSSRLVSEDISRLNRIGLFRSVESRVQMLADGSVELAYFVTPQPLIGAVQTVGNKAIPDDELLAEVEVLAGTPVQPALLDRACRRIETLYRQKGYYNVLCAVDQGELDANNIVVFTVREGERSRITQIRFEGVRSFTPAQVRSAVTSKVAGVLEKGVLDNDKVDDDVANVIEFYRDRGHLDVRADRVVTPSPNGREAIVTFIVDEGPVYTLRDLRLEFAPGEDPVFAPEQLRGLLSIKPGDLYSERKLRESMRIVRDAYGAMGYVDARVDRRDLRDPERPEVDIRLSVRPGRSFRSGLVSIQGNSGTRDDVIRRHITVRPGEVLDTTELDRTRSRLTQSRLFAERSIKAVVQPERDEDPGSRDVLIDLEETNTGAFNFGAGVSSDSGVTAQISFTQRNFDLTDPPDSLGELFSGEAFHGGGQTLALNILPGTRARNFSLSLGEPSLGGTDFGGTAAVFFRQRVYSAYDERRYGGRLGLGRRFGSRWSLNFPLKFEVVGLSSIDADAPTEYFDAQDDASIVSVGAALSRSSYDNPAFPSRGSKVEFTVEQISGDFTATKLGVEAARYFKIDEGVLGERTTLRLATSLNYILQDQADVPFYERYYQGGESFRGFDFRGIGPVGIRSDTGAPSNDSVGGVFSFFAGAEVRRSLYEDILSGVVFVDSGVVSDDLSITPYRASAGFGLRITVQQLSPIPLAFDFGFPILKEDTDQERLFTFSFELPFQ